MEELNFIMTSDDVGRGDVEDFEKFISFLGECGIKATFFAVPKPRDNLPLNQNKEWTEALRKAVLNGHDVQLHGFAHERLECGVPNDLVWSLYGENGKFLRKKIFEEKAKIEENLNKEILERKLLESVKIFKEVLGYNPLCFRSPLLGAHPNLYHVLSKAGIKYSSNMVVNPNGWNYIISKSLEKEWNNQGIPPLQIKRWDGVTELPISCEYSWFLEEKNLDRALELMKKDAHRISKIKNAFMMPLSHFYAILKSPSGQELYKKFFEWARKNFDFKSYTIKEYIKEKIIN